MLVIVEADPRRIQSDSYMLEVLLASDQSSCEHVATYKLEAC